MGGVTAGLITFALLVLIAKCCPPCRCPKGKCYLVQHDIVLPWWYDTELEDDDISDDESREMERKVKNLPLRSMGNYSGGPSDVIGRPLEGSGWRGVAWP